MIMSSIVCLIPVLLTKIHVPGIIPDGTVIKARWLRNACPGQAKLVESSTGRSPWPPTPLASPAWLRASSAFVSGPAAVIGLGLA